MGRGGYNLPPPGYATDFIVHARVSKTKYTPAKLRSRWSVSNGYKAAEFASDWLECYFNALEQKHQTSLNDIKNELEEVKNDPWTMLW